MQVLQELILKKEGMDGSTAIHRYLSAVCLFVPCALGSLGEANAAVLTYRSQCAALRCAVEAYATQQRIPPNVPLEPLTGMAWFPYY